MIPSSRRIPSGTEAWVIVAGWFAKLSTPPRLSAMWNTSRASMNRRARSAPPLPPPWNSNDTIPPNPDICRRAVSCPGWSGSPG